MILRFIHRFELLVAFCILAFTCVACGPKTAYNRGLSFEYHPAGATVDPSRAVGSAIELTESDRARLARLQPAYLGELSVEGERSGLQSSEGAGNVKGRVSLEAAARGATHFILLGSDVARRNEAVGGYPGSRPVMQQVTITRARYGLYRVDPSMFAKLPARLRPTTQL